MQSIDTFNSNLGTAILLVGPAGGGKTALGCRLYPRTYVFVADLNFKSGIDYLKKIGQTSNIVGYDTATPDETGKPVIPMQRYARMLKCVGDAIKDPKVDVVFLDSATFIEDIIKAKICSASTEEAIKLDGYTQWGALVLTWKSIVMQLRQSGKKLIMSAHENKEKDESDQIFKYQIAVDGSIRGKFPALFSDVWRCETVEKPGLNGQTHVWQVRTLGNVRQEHLKNTYGLPAVLSADELVKTIQGAK